MPENDHSVHTRRSLNLIALALIILAAFCHATWNLLAKRASGGVAFVWLLQSCGVVIYAPLVVGLMLRNPPQLHPGFLIAVVASAFAHLSYFLSLQRGYRGGDLSLVYPVARGSGPAIATTGAILLYGERPTALALTGAVLIITGVFLISMAGRHTSSNPEARRDGLKWGLITGCFIATYSMVDSYAVGQLAIFPFFYLWSGDVMRSALLAPLALKRVPAIRHELREHKREVFGVAVLSPLSYLLVLFAMSFTPLSYVAPAREMSILIGTIMGSRLLAEEGGRERILAAALIVCGVAALALG